MIQTQTPTPSWHQANPNICFELTELCSTKSLKMHNHAEVVFCIIYPKAYPKQQIELLQGKYVKDYIYQYILYFN